MKTTTVKSVAMILFALFAFSINGFSAESNSSFLKLDESVISDKDKFEKTLESMPEIIDFYINPDNGLVSVLLKNNYDEKYLIKELEKHNYALKINR